MLLPLRPSTTLFINDRSKLACYAPGMEADWSPTARTIDGPTELACSSPKGDVFSF